MSFDEKLSPHPILGDKYLHRWALKPPAAESLCQKRGRLENPISKATDRTPRPLLVPPSLISEVAHLYRRCRQEQTLIQIQQIAVCAAHSVTLRIPAGNRGMRNFFATSTFLMSWKACSCRVHILQVSMLSFRDTSPCCCCSFPPVRLA